MIEHNLTSTTSNLPSTSSNVSLSPSSQNIHDISNRLLEYDFSFDINQINLCKENFIYEPEFIILMSH